MEDQTLKTTTPKLAIPPPPPVVMPLPRHSPPAGHVVTAGPLENGVEAVNDIGAHRAQTNPKRHRISHRLCHVLFQVEEVVQLAGGLATMQAVSPRDLGGP